MPPMPLTPKQTDTICQHLRSSPPKIAIELKTFAIGIKNPMRLIEGAICGRDMDGFFDPTDPWPLIAQINLYGRTVILDVLDLQFDREPKLMMEFYFGTRNPEGLILLYDIADRGTFDGLEQQYRTLFVPPELPEAPARGRFKRAFDKVRKRSRPEVPTPNPILVVAVRPRPLQPWYVSSEEGLELSERLGASYCEAGLGRVDAHFLEEFAKRVILRLVEAKLKLSRKESEP